MAQLDGSTSTRGQHSEPIDSFEDFAEYGIVISLAVMTVPTAQQSSIRRTVYAPFSWSFQANGTAFKQTVVIRGKSHRSSWPPTGNTDEQGDQIRRKSDARLASPWVPS